MVKIEFEMQINEREGKRMGPLIVNHIKFYICKVKSDTYIKGQIDMRVGNLWNRTHL